MQKPARRAWEGGRKQGKAEQGKGEQGKGKRKSHRKRILGDMTSSCHHHGVTGGRRLTGDSVNTVRHQNTRKWPLSDIKCKEE